MAPLTVKSQLQDAFDQAVDQLISIGIGLLSIVLIIFLARITIGCVRHVFWKQFGSRNLKADVATLIDNGISLAVYFAAITLLLAYWGASWATLLTAISISTLAVVLGLQDLLKSLLGGLFVILDQPYTVGDHVLLAEAEGEVMAIQLRTTIIRASDGHEISMPNAVVLTTALHNFDRVRESDTVVRLTGVRGNPDQTRVRLESIFNEKPPIAATVIVTTASPQRARTLFPRWRSSSPPALANQPDGDTDLRITIILADDGGSEAANSEVINRLRAEFGGAKILIGHSSAH